MARSKSNTAETIDAAQSDEVAVLEINTGEVTTAAPASPDLFGVNQFSEAVDRTDVTDPRLPALCSLNSLLWQSSQILRDNPDLATSGPWADFLNKLRNTLCP